MIIAVGFKVNSERAVQFRKWVNQIAKEYTIKGWVMDDERLKRKARKNKMAIIKKQPGSHKSVDRAAKG